MSAAGGESQDVEPPEAFGERLRRLRRAKEWSQQELAARIGVRPNRISKYETGTCEPGLDVLRRMPQVLGRSADYLLTGQEATPEPDPLSALWPVLRTLPRGLRAELAEFLKTVVKARHLLDPLSLKRTGAPRQQARRKTKVL